MSEQPEDDAAMMDPGEDAADPVPPEKPLPPNANTLRGTLQLLLHVEGQRGELARRNGDLDGVAKSLEAIARIHRELAELPGPPKRRTRPMEFDRLPYDVQAQILAWLVDGKPVEEVRRMLGERGLPVPSSHVIYTASKSPLLESIQAAHERIRHEMMEAVTLAQWVDLPQLCARADLLHFKAQSAMLAAMEMDPEDPRTRRRLIDVCKQMEGAIASSRQVLGRREADNARKVEELKKALDDATKGKGKVADGKVIAAGALAILSPKRQLKTEDDAE